MKKIVASVGMVTLGATALQAQQSVPGITTELPKPWSVSATLRGFYDSNINAVPNNSSAYQDSFGYQVSPTVLVNWAMEQTAINLGYVFSASYYDKNLAGQTSKWRYANNFTFGFDHAFSERYQLSVQDSFVEGQEPDYLRSTDQSFTKFQPVPGSNFRNYGTINFDAKLSRQFGLEAGYANSWSDYAASGGTAFNPSTAALLNRIENYAHIDGRYLLQPETVLIAGYMYGTMNYTADEPIGFTDGIVGNPVLFSDVRNNRSQYGYVGVDQTFNPELNGSLRAGARYNDYYNDPTSQNGVSPYVLAQLTWIYAVESSLTAGFTYDLTATDVFSVANNGSITLNANAATLWLSLSQRLAPHIYGSVLGQIQDNNFNGGLYNGDTQLYYLLGLNLQYRFNTHFSTELGYNFDQLHSDIPNTSFVRNRVYIGVTASY